MASAVKERYEDQKRDHAVKDFLGVNTQAGRTAIAENQFAWLENIMPVGFANLKVVPHQGAAVATVASGAVAFWKYVSLADVDYLATFTDDGAGRLLNLQTYAFTTLGAPGTFTLPVWCAQWEDTHLLIVDAVNYYAWDGTTLLRNGFLQSVEVTAPGSGYTAVPTVSFTGGGGTGATATARMMLDALTVSAGGNGYVVGDIVTIAGGTSTTVAKARVDTIGGGGAITAASPYQGGVYSVLPATPNAVTGGTGTGASLGLTWAVESVVVTNPGTVKYNEAPTVAFSGGGGATADAILLLGPDGGRFVVTFAGRVWVAKDRTWTYSAPGSFVDFTIANAGGALTVTDETLTSSITGALVANNFLYYWGATSVAVISDVRVVDGTPPQTLFSNNNVSPIIGSTYPVSIFPYYRNVGFATPYGFYQLVGATPLKMSDELDGMLERVDFDSVICGAVVKLFNILCMCFIVQYDDPETGATRALLAVWFNKKWFFCNQGAGLTQIVSGFRNGVPRLYGTDGTQIFHLFSDAEADIDVMLRTALWPMKLPTRMKQTLKGGAELRTAELFTELEITVDTENGATLGQINANNTGQWVNTAGVTGQWYNAALVTGDWYRTGFQIFQGDIESWGRYVGYTITSTSPAYSLEGLLMQFENRANWATLSG